MVMKQMLIKCGCKAWFILLTPSDGVTQCSADLESSSYLNSEAAMHCHIGRYALGVKVNGINDSTASHRLLMCDNMPQHVTPSKV